jgi:putative transcriptional regulator
MSKSLAKKIKTLRTQKGLTQMQLAEVVGISAQLISALEQGRIAPKREYLMKMCEGLDVSMSYFSGQKVGKIVKRLDELVAELQQLRAEVAQIEEADPLS